MPRPATNSNQVAQLTELSLGNYADYAAYVAQTLQADRLGTVAQIPNELKSVQDDVSVLTDPVRIQAYKAHIADQMNAQSSPQVEDLSDAITDVQITTVAQGAATLKLTIMDPYWQLTNSGFIQTDQTSYLWPPVDITFPPDTRCVWRLCQAMTTINYAAANVTLTFEDRIVAWLREVNANTGGVSQALPDSTIGGFVSQLIDGANRYLRGHPKVSGGTPDPIRLVKLIAPSDPNYTPPVEPPSASDPTKALSRQNPNKTKTGITAAQKAYIDAWVRYTNNQDWDKVGSISLLNQNVAYGRAAQQQGIEVGAP